MTEQQRQDAMAACERIQELSEQLQARCDHILLILHKAANRRVPKSGVVEICEAARKLR